MCEVCCKPFKSNGYQKTCSPECLSKLRRRRVKRTCSFCGQEFEICQSRSNQSLCSRKCPGPSIDGWSVDLAYAIGLITSDGYLVRHIQRVGFTNKEQSLIDWMSRWLPRSYIYSCRGIPYVCSVWPNFYQFLLGVGLTPKKSLTLGELAIPDAWFFHFYRGLHDGDGTTHYHRNSLHLVLASHAPEFRRWVRQTIERLSAVPVSEDDRSLHMYAGSAEQFARFVWRPRLFCLERKRPRNL